MVGRTIPYEDQIFTSQDFSFSSKYDVEKYRKLVPVVSKPGVTYVNASFQPPMNTIVRNALDKFLDEAEYEIHPKPKWQATTQATRELLATVFNVPASSLAFTRDTTEGLNLFQRSVKWSPGDNVVLLDTEHPNHAYGWLALQEQGLEVRMVDTQSDTYADGSTFESSVDERTRAIGLSSVMFHSGQLNNTKDICQTFRPRGIHVLADLTQQVGVSQIDLTDIGVSAAAFGCHKGLAAPTGLGVLYIEPKTLSILKQTPPIVGAGAISNLAGTLLASPDVHYHESTLRYEHLNVSLISMYALHDYLTFVNSVGIASVELHLRGLGRVLGLEMEKLGVEVIGSRIAARRAPHLYILKLLDIRWQAHFQEAGVQVSHYRLGVRVSFGFYNSEAEVLKVASVVKSGIDCGISAS